MKVTLPADADSAVAELGALAALLDKTGWKAAAFIAVCIKPNEGEGGKPRTSARLSTKQFASKLKAANISRGWSENVVRRHFDAWEAAADKGLVPRSADIAYGGKVELPTERWQEFYPPTNPIPEHIREQAEKDGVGAQTTNVIAKNPKAMATAIKADPKVAEAAAKALVDAGALDTLSRATADAAKNKQVERNRKRLEEGSGKGSTVQGPKPSAFKPDVAAFLSHHGLADALTALVTTFPQEWETMDEEAKTETYIGTCEETFDKISIALDNCRNLVAGGVTDSAINRLLDEVS